MDKFLGYVGVLVITAIAILVSALVEAYATVKLWEWFVLPTFALPAITMKSAYGIAILIGLLTAKDVKKEKSGSKTDRFIDSLSFSIGIPLFALVIGYVVYTAF